MLAVNYHSIIQAISLVDYLEKNCSEKLRGKTVIELGAGTGIVGMIAASQGDSNYHPIYIIIYNYTCTLLIICAYVNISLL